MEIFHLTIGPHLFAEHSEDGAGGLGAIEAKAL